MSPAPSDATASPRPHEPAPRAEAARMWRRAFAPAALVSLVALVVVVLAARLPEGTPPWVVAGALAAMVSGAIGIWIKCRAIAPPSDARGAGPSFQVALFGDFVLQLLTIGFALIVLFAVGVKFPYLAGLALAFATVALVHQWLSALILARALHARARSGVVHRPAAGGEEGKGSLPVPGPPPAGSRSR